MYYSAKMYAQNVHCTFCAYILRVHFCWIVHILSEIVKLDVQILVEFVRLGKICRSSLSPAMIETDTSFWPSFLSGVPLRGPFSGAAGAGGRGGDTGERYVRVLSGAKFSDIFIIILVFKKNHLRTSQWNYSFWKNQCNNSLCSVRPWQGVHMVGRGVV